MRAGHNSDHGSLAVLAQNPAAELRPLLLRVHARNFADAPRRIAGTVASFEAIALGLIPLVPDDVLADVAAILRGIPEVPPSVLAALAGRLTIDAQPVPKPSIGTRPRLSAPVDSDLARVRDHRIPIDGAALAGLVERALHDEGLAVELLARPEPTVFDRAALYRHADAETRPEIRRHLGRALAAIHFPRPTGASDASRHVLQVAASRDSGRVAAAIGTRLGVDPTPFDLDRPAGQELFVFGLAAIGLDGSECMRVLLTLDAPVARSVPAVFHLAEIVRASSRPVAAFLAGCERVAMRQPKDERAAPARPVASLRSDAAIRRPRQDRGARDRDQSARADRRS